MFKNQFQLLYQKRFLPLFVTQFLGAFNDNVFKNALVVMITFILGKQHGLATEVLVTITGALLIIPMFLFSASAGILADKYDKAQLIRIIKLAEIFIMILATIGFVMQSIGFLMFVLFLMGTQSTFFGPIKYSILPIHLEDDELISGNGLIELGTFLSILLGNVIGVIVISAPGGFYITSGLVLIVSALGLVSALKIPQAPPVAKDLHVSLNFVKDTIEIIKFSRKSRNIFLSILAVSWFWLVGFTFLTQFPTFTKEYLSGDQNVYVFFLGIFSIGIGIGAIMCNWLTKGRIEATFVPIAAFGLSLFTFDLIYSTNAYGIANVKESAPLMGVFSFLGYAGHWRILLDLVLIALAAGIFVVPLYAIMQHESDDEHKARIIAANNVMNALFMTVAAILTAVFLSIGAGILTIFFIMAVLNLFVMVAICEILPGRLVKSVMRLILDFLFKVEVKGLENLDNAGDRVIIAPNHTSFIDGILLANYLPKKLTFAVAEQYANKWWVKPIAMLVDVFGMDPLNPMAIKSLIKVVKEDRHCVIFPEGRITVTGALMKIYEGPGLISYKANAPIVPVRIDGAQFSLFSKLRGKVRLQWFPKIKITILPAVSFVIPKDMKARDKRQYVGEQLHHVMTRMMFESSDSNRTLFQALKDAKNIHGAGTTIIEDINRIPLTYKKLIIGSYLLGSKIAKICEPHERVGIMLPNSVGCVVTFFACQAIGRACAMINFTSGTQNVLSACKTVKMKTVLTSKIFVGLAKLEDMVQTLEKEGVSVVYLEDVKQKVFIWDKLVAMATYYVPLIWRHRQPSPDDPAVALFTSGSEGAPKAVFLSSHNFKANINQLTSLVDFNSNDLALNVLPIFHSFGLTGGTLLPILSGLKVFMYPTPLHYRIIPELSYDIGATIFFGTNTFLANYAKYANAYDFYSVRYVFCGAEKLRDETRKLWSEKFGVRLFEGYGATETAPVISTNTPMHNKPSTVGLFLPNIQYKLEQVPGIDEGGRLFVKGPNVMLGYMFADNPGNLIPPSDGWYDTGDIVDIDQKGYISIKGRAKRFAKIAGEMVSLTAVESMIDQIYEGAVNAVVAVPDSKKGEQLVLITTQQNADRSDIVQFAKEHQFTELMIPRIIIVLDKIPLLGTGKVDYPALGDLIKDRV